MTYDPKRDEVYYAFRESTVKESISRFRRSEGSKGVGKDEVVYSGIFYELLDKKDVATVVWNFSANSGGFWYFIYWLFLSEGV